MTPSYREGAKAVAPLCIGVLLFGATFAVLAEEAGFGPVASLLMSATTFAGSAQFAAVSIVDAGGGAAAATAAAAMLNARYVPIGISVAAAFSGPLWRRLAEAQLVVDESWAVAARGERFERRVLIGAGIMLYACWVGGTLIGVFGADLLGDPERLGLDAAFPALFLALLVQYLESTRARVAAALGGALALALIPVAPPGVPIVAASAACLIALRRR